MMKDYELQSDIHLIQEINKGNEQAFKELYRRNAPKILKICGKILGSLTDADDIVQELFLNLWERRSQLNIENGLVENYLMRAMKNLTIKSFSKSKKRQLFLEDFMHYVQMTKSVHTDTTILQKEMNELLFQNINNLPDKMREVFLLSRKELMTHKEIANYLGLKESTVKKQIQNALKILKKISEHRLPYIFLLFLYDKLKHH